MSKYSENGDSESSKEFPFSLRFEPHSDVYSLFPTKLPGTDPMIYVSQVESVPANSNLYNVYAMNAPQGLGGKEELIGTLVLDGQMTKSKWGDENLFIRHQKMDDDKGIHPEWDPYLSKYSFKKGCPFLSNYYN